MRRDASFTAALDAMARLWRYSPLNQWLIRAQRPGARQVAARRAWESLGRRPCRGARPIVVLAPSHARRPPFIFVPVFDVAQTRGRRLPRLDLTLHGRAPQARTLERAGPRLGITVHRADLPRGILGRSDGSGSVTLRRRLAGAERAATLAHEFAHELLHGMNSRGPAPSHAQAEAEADATSYVVLRTLDVPSKAPSYIAWHGGSGDTVLGSMKRIQRAARRILRACEEVTA